MPPLNAVRPAAQPERPAFGLFSLNWLVPDAESPARRRTLHRVQVGVDLSELDLRSGALFFRRNTPNPLSNAVRRWCWGNAAQQALAEAIVGHAEEPSMDALYGPSSSWALPTAAVLRQRMGVGNLNGRDRALDPLQPDGALLGEVQVDLPASLLLARYDTGSVVHYDPVFVLTLERASDAIRTELADLLTQHLDRSRVLFAQHHHDPSDLGAVQRLLARAGAGPILAPPEALLPTEALDARLIQDAQAVRDAFAEPSPALDVSVRPGASRPGRR